MWWKNPMVVQRLSLTADQTKKMDDIFQKSRLDLIDLRANLQKQEIMLEPLLSANPLDIPKAQAQIDKVADSRASLEKADAKMLLDIRGVLTPDQWTKLRTRGAGADLVQTPESLRASQYTRRTGWSWRSWTRHARRWPSPQHQQSRRPRRSALRPNCTSNDQGYSRLPGTLFFAREASEYNAK